jgi:hypothetical protein
MHPRSLPVPGQQNQYLPWEHCRERVQGLSWDWLCRTPGEKVEDLGVTLSEGQGRVRFLALGVALAGLCVFSDIIPWDWG